MGKERYVRHRRVFKKSSGFTLVEVMIAMAVGAIAIVATMSWTDGILKQQRSMSQKMVSLEIGNTLQMLMSNSSQCTQNMNLNTVQWPTAGPYPYTYNFVLGPPPTGNLNIYTSGGVFISTAIPQGVVPNGYGMIVQSIQLQNITPLNPGDPVNPGPFSANLVVKLGSTVIPLNPLIYPLFLNTTTSGGSQKVQSCSVSGCGTGYQLIGSGGSEPFCISEAAEPPTDVATGFSRCVSNTALSALMPAGQTGHLCTADEWTTACYANGATLGMPLAQEFVYLPHLYDNGTGHKATATVMGDPAGNYSGTCLAFTQYDVDESAPLGFGYPDSFAYRCCYHP